MMTTEKSPLPRAVMRVFLGLLMLVAAGLKAHEVATGPVAGDSLFESRWFLIGFAEFELLFALILLLDIYPRQTWFAAIALFSVFSAVSLAKGLAGAESCGCFGRVEVNPWWTFTLDVGVCIALWRAKSPTAPPVVYGKRGTKSPPATLDPRLIAVILLALLAGGPMGYWMATGEPATLAANGLIIGGGNLVILEPEKWVGQSLPVQRYIDIGDRLGNGDWTLLFYHHDCPKCEEAIPHFRDAAGTRLAHSPQAALIEIPPYGPPLPYASSDPLVHGRLSNDHEWFVQTPVVIDLHSGRVTRVTTEIPLLAP